MHYLANCKFESPNYRIPVILCSAHMNVEFGRKVKEKGINIRETLAKPFPFGSISQCLKNLPTRNVLLLDDDEEFRLLVERELKSEGFYPISSSSVLEAKSLLGKNRMLCGIFDVFLSQKSTSEEVISYLKSSDNVLNQAMPLIVTSALMTPEHATALKNKAKMVRFAIPKPAPRGTYAMACKSIYGSEELRVIKGQEFAALESFHVPNGESTQTKEESFVVSGDNSLPQKEEIIMVKGDVEDASEGVMKVKRLSSEDQPADPSKDILKVKKLPQQEGVDKKKSFDASINQRDETGDTLLMSYATQGSVEGVEELIDRGASVLLKSKNGKTALHYAARAGHLTIVKLLLECGSKVTARDNQELEPLGEAILAQHVDVAKELIMQGSRLKTRIKGKSYILLAVQMDNFELFKILVEAGADLKTKDPDFGFTVEEILEKKEKVEWINFVEQNDSSKRKMKKNSLKFSRSKY